MFNVNSLTNRRCMLPEYYGAGEFGIPVAEMPETVIARECPSEMLRVLDRESQRRHYVDALSIGGDIAQAYIQRLEAEDVAKISNIRIKPISQKRFLGFVTGDPEMTISFVRD